MNHDGGRSPASRPARARGARAEAPLLHIVEDDGSTLTLLSDVAADAGWRARGFTRLSDFRRALAEDTPDLVILDDDLPDGRGGDLAREIREDPELRDVPLVVCTAAHPMRQAEITAWAPVVSKPFDLAQIDGILYAASRRLREEGQAAG